jgi:hypothetical protein
MVSISVVFILKEKVLVSTVSGESDDGGSKTGEGSLETVPAGEGAGVTPGLTVKEDMNQPYVHEIRCFCLPSFTKLPGLAKLGRFRRMSSGFGGQCRNSSDFVELGFVGFAGVHRSSSCLLRKRGTRYNSRSRPRINPSRSLLKQNLRVKSLCRESLCGVVVARIHCCFVCGVAVGYLSYCLPSI